VLLHDPSFSAVGKKSRTCLIVGPTDGMPHIWLATPAVSAVGDVRSGSKKFLGFICGSDFSANYNSASEVGYNRRLTPALTTAPETRARSSN